MTNRLCLSRLSSALVSTLFSLPVCAAGLGGGLEDYTPPQPPAKPKPQVVEKIVEKPVKDPVTERRAHAAETDSRNKDAEIARLKAELDKAHKQPPKGVERVVEKPVQLVPQPPATPVPDNDPAAACWQNGAWQAACGFAAYAGGPVFRVVGGNLSFTMGSPETEKDRANDEGPQHPVSFHAALRWRKPKSRWRSTWPVWRTAAARSPNGVKRVTSTTTRLAAQLGIGTATPTSRRARSPG